MAGVEVASASEALSAEEGRATGTSVDEAGDERSLIIFSVAGIVGFCSGKSESLRKRCRRSGDNFNVTRSELADLEPVARLERPFVVPAGIVKGWLRVFRWEGMRNERD